MALSSSKTLMTQDQATTRVLTDAANQDDDLEHEDGDFEYEDLRAISLWREDLPPWRKQLVQLLESSAFGLVMGALILFNMALIIWETDHRASCYGMTSCDADLSVLGPLNYMLLLIYTIEIVAKFIAFRVHFFHQHWNNIDLFIVVSSVIGEIVGGLMKNMVILRLLRLLRIARLVQFMSYFRELYIIIHGFMSTLRAIFWAALLMFGLLTMWSVVAVELLHGSTQELAAAGEYNGCERCPRSLASVYAANLTFFQTLVMGEDWADIVMPLIEHNFVALIVFFGVFFTVALGLMNLILAVIVDSAVDAREDDVNHQLMQKKEQQKRARAQLVMLCADLDIDKGGSLTLEELYQAYDNSKRFKDVMNILDVDKEDLECVFRIMDRDRSGDVSYTEFVELIYKMKSQNSRTLLMFIKHYAVEIRHVVADIASLAQVLSTRREASDADEDACNLLGGESGHGASVDIALRHLGESTEVTRCEIDDVEPHRKPWDQLETLERSLRDDEWLNAVDVPSDSGCDAVNLDGSAQAVEMQKKAKNVQMQDGHRKSDVSKENSVTEGPASRGIRRKLAEAQHKFGIFAQSSAASAGGPMDDIPLPSGLSSQLEALAKHVGEQFARLEHSMARKNNDRHNVALSVQRRMHETQAKMLAQLEHIVEGQAKILDELNPSSSRSISHRAIASISMFK